LLFCQLLEKAGVDAFDIVQVARGDGGTVPYMYSHRARVTPSRLEAIKKNLRVRVIVAGRH